VAKICKKFEIIRDIIQAMKSQNNFGKKSFFNLFLEVSQIKQIRAITPKIGKITGT
jgi:hypothetical protein